MSQVITSSKKECCISNNRVPKFDANGKFITKCSKPDVKIVATCQIYDSSSPNTACLIGIEYIITARDYSSLPAKDKLNWHIINKALATKNRAVSSPNAQQINMVLQHLLGNYGKIILTCNPLDNLPTSAPRTENLQHLFVNQTRSIAPNHQRANKIKTISHQSSMNILL